MICNRELLTTVCRFPWAKSCPECSNCNGKFPTIDCREFWADYCICNSGQMEVFLLILHIESRGWTNVSGPRKAETNKNLWILHFFLKSMSLHKIHLKFFIKWKVFSLTFIEVSTNITFLFFIWFHTKISSCNSDHFMQIIKDKKDLRMKCTDIWNLVIVYS